MNLCLNRSMERLAVIIGLCLALSLLTLGASQGSGVTPTNQWVNVYSIDSTLGGYPMRSGAQVAVLDPQDVRCGEFTVAHAGQYGVMPCYGDDATTDDVDEGAEPGDALHFTVDDMPAQAWPRSLNGVAVTPSVPLTWTQHGDLWQVDLHVPLVAQPDSYGTDEDVTLSVAAPGVLDNDQDPNGEGLSALLASGPISGSLALAPDGSFVYTPTADFNGQDRFSYRASDGLAASDAATVTIQVASVPDAAAISDSDLALTSTLIFEGGSVRLDGVFRDPDEGDSHRIDIDWGDATQDQMLLPVGSRTFSATHRYVDDPAGPVDEVVIVVTVVEVAKHSLVAPADQVAQVVLTVQNAAPQVDGGSDLGAYVSLPITVTAHYSDSGVTDVLSGSIDWGDLTVDDVGVLPAGSGVFSATHVYGSAGPRTVTLCVADDDGDVGCDQVAMDVEEVTAVTLLSFTARLGAGEIRLGWKAFASYDVLGFRLDRISLDQPGADPLLLAALIPLESAGEYSFVDDGVAVGAAYRYWLSEVTADGRISKISSIDVVASTWGGRAFLPLAARYLRHDGAHQYRSRLLYAERVHAPPGD